MNKEPKLPYHAMRTRRSKVGLLRIVRDFSGWLSVARSEAMPREAVDQTIPDHPLTRRRITVPRKGQMKFQERRQNMVANEDPMRRLR